MDSTCLPAYSAWRSIAAADALLCRVSSGSSSSRHCYNKNGVVSLSHNAAWEPAATVSVINLKVGTVVKIPFEARICSRPALKPEHAGDFRDAYVVVDFGGIRNWHLDRAERLILPASNRQLPRYVFKEEYCTRTAGGKHDQATMPSYEKLGSYIPFCSDLLVVAPSCDAACRFISCIQSFVKPTHLLFFQHYSFECRTSVEFVRLSRRLAVELLVL